MQKKKTSEAQVQQEMSSGAATIARGAWAPTREPMTGAQADLPQTPCGGDQGTASVQPGFKQERSRAANLQAARETSAWGFAAAH